jgi:hypothetical protein
VYYKVGGKIVQLTAGIPVRPKPYRNVHTCSSERSDISLHMQKVH